MTARHILVVDDDQLLRETLAELIDELGYGVDTRSTGLDALSFLDDRTCSMVFSDVDMPDISGFELLARMRQAALATPMALMSARADAILAEASREAGAVALLAKPVNAGAVGQLLDTHCS